jgi:hypothetical protein
MDLIGILARLDRAMMVITIAAEAYAAIAPILLAGSAVGPEVAPDREYLVWLPQHTVNHLLVLRAPGETLSGVILRLLAERGCYAAISR